MSRNELHFIAPMLAKMGGQVPDEGKWLFEAKLDGIRAVAIKQNGETRLYSRRARELTADYPEIAAALQSLQAHGAILDGEIVALDKAGRTSFQQLQHVKRTPAAREQIYYCAFDLMHLNGRDMTSMPLIVRRHFLRDLVADSEGPLKFSETLRGPFRQIWDLTLKLGLEGIMAKRQDSKYEPGRRSGAWVKLKAVNEQEFVIGGYTPPEGGREFLGSILVGYYEHNRLCYAGRVGTGFDVETLHSLHHRFQKLKTPRCPFSNLPTRRLNGTGPGVTPSEMARYTWIKPSLVCQVKFLEWTRDRSLRQPVYLGLREDKKPVEVTLEN